MLLYQSENIGSSLDFRCNFHAGGFPVPAHIHEYSELLYVCRGMMTMELDGSPMEVPAGRLVFVFPNQIHAYREATACDVWCAVFSPDHLTTFFALYGDRLPENPVLALEEADKQLLEALQRADDAVTRTGLLHLLFGRLAASTAFTNVRPGETGLYPRALGYIAANFRKDITLEAMARALGYHEKYLSAQLHRLTGQNFRAFLATYRVEHAKGLLRNTGRSVADIAMESGFSSLNTFHRVFRAETGMTPGAWRKRS